MISALIAAGPAYHFVDRFGEYVEPFVTKVSITRSVVTPLRNLAFRCTSLPRARDHELVDYPLIVLPHSRVYIHDSYRGISAEET